MWKNQWTRQASPINNEFKKALYHESQGIADIAVKLYAMAQIRAVGLQSDFITPKDFSIVASEKLGLVKPALDALRSGDKKRIAAIGDIAPIKAECDDFWTPQKSGITRATIAENHTMHPYFSVSYSPKYHDSINHVLNGGAPSATHDRIMAFNSRNSWLKHLRYCPLCAIEDISSYGETYWHRKHQLPGYYFCTKHQVRFTNSEIPIKLVTSGFYPASNEVRTDAINNPEDVFSKHKDKCLKIGYESDWLLENGLQVNWQTNGREKYVRLFRDIGIATVRGTRCDSEALTSAVYEYWDKEFIDALFADTPIYPLWLSRVHASMMSRFLPLQHILLMCVARNTVKDFVECDVSDNPFGVGLFPCENPICRHYQTDVADCIEVCNYNSRVVCFFRCSHCGMTYKKTKAKTIKGIPVILDYGHQWVDELKRCVQDKTINIAQMEKILKFDKGVIALQKKKLGLLRPPRHDTAIGPEAYYKEKVMELHKEFGELTFTLLQEKLPGAYDYLGDNHPKWFQPYIVNQWDTSLYRQKREELLINVKSAIERIIIEESHPKRQISYSYIADVAGVTRDDLRSNKYISSYLADFIETKESWYQRRITFVYNNLPIESRNLSVFEICRRASIGEESYKKCRKLFEEVVNELRTSETK